MSAHAPSNFFLSLPRPLTIKPLSPTGATNIHTHTHCAILTHHVSKVLHVGAIMKPTHQRSLSLGTSLEECDRSRHAFKFPFAYYNLSRGYIIYTNFVLRNRSMCRSLNQRSSFACLYIASHCTWFNTNLVPWTTYIGARSTGVLWHIGNIYINKKYDWMLRSIYILSLKMIIFLHAIPYRT